MHELCRNCLSPNIRIHPQGVLAPFFLKRVHGIYINSVEDTLRQRANNQKSFLSLMLKSLQRFRAGRKILKYRSILKVNIRVCNDCEFIGPEFNYEYANLINLYRDYRSEFYDNERVEFEPNYANIKLLVGKSIEEVNVRLSNLNILIDTYVEIDKIQNVMDWGGGEGKFIPKKLQVKNVWILDVSNESLVKPEYHRVERVPLNIKFDYIQVCHVLEHVTSPYDFMTNVIENVNVGGYIYIELPQDRTVKDIKKLINGDVNVNHGIHEHLNLFNSKSLDALGTALGLKVLKIETKVMDFGWVKANVISGLFLKQ